MSSPSCPECGSPIEEGDSFCGCCGLSLKEYWEQLGEDTIVKDGSAASLIQESFSALFRNKPMTYQPSSAVYLNRPPSSLLNFAVAAVVFIILGLFLSYGSEWYSMIGFTFAGYAAPVLYLIWMFRNDRYEQEPWILVVYVFGWGAFSGVLAGGLNSFFIGENGNPGLAAFIEEPLKIIGVYMLSRSTRAKAEFNDHLDGMVYGAAAGAGFAGLENFWYLTEMIVNQNFPAILAILVRSTTAFGHIAWSAVAGRSLGLAKVLKGKTEIVDLVPGLMLSVLLHFLWNTVDTLVAFFVLLPLTVLILKRYIDSSLADEKQWGYQCYAPDEDGEQVELDSEPSTE